MLLLLQWRRFIATFHVHCADQLDLACCEFIRYYGEWIVSHGLQHAFLGLVISFWNLGGLKECQMISKYMSLITEVEQRIKASAADAATGIYNISIR